MGGIASTSRVEIPGSEEGQFPMLNFFGPCARDQDDSIRRKSGLGVFSPRASRAVVIDAQVEKSTVEFADVGEKLAGELSISFEYQCGRLAGHSTNLGSSPEETDSISSSEGSNLSSHAGRNGSGLWKRPRSSSFTCLSGAALSANATLANTTVLNNVIGDILLQGLDSPRTFRKLDHGFPHSNSGSGSGRRLSDSSGGSGSGRRGDCTTTSNSTGTFSRHFAPPAGISDFNNRQSSSAPVESQSNMAVETDLQTAGGAAGEDRLQVVCSEENGVLFCGVYDGFNGRDAADFLAAHLYESIMLHLRLLIWQAQRAKESILEGLTEEGASAEIYAESTGGATFRQSVVEGLRKSVAQVEADFLSMVEGEMDERSDLAMVGSCILGVLIHGQDLYSINLGDSRAVLATTELPAGDGGAGQVLRAVQLTEIHNADSADEVERVMREHPEDTNAIVKDRVKGKLKITRAFGAGYLKEVSCVHWRPRPLQCILTSFLFIADRCDIHPSDWSTGVASVFLCVGTAGRRVKASSILL